MANKTGYCPVHNRAVTVEVTCSDMRVIGTKQVQKHYSVRDCPIKDHNRPECSDCPIAHGSAEEMP